MSMTQNSSIENQRQKMKLPGASLQTKVIQSIQNESKESFNNQKNQQKNKEILEKKEQIHIEQSRTSRNTTKGLFTDVTNYYLNRKLLNNTKTLSQEAIMAFQKKLNNTHNFDKLKRPATSQKFSSRSSQENRKNNFNSQQKYSLKNLSSTMTIQEKLRGSNSVKRKQIRRSLFDSDHLKKGNLQIIDHLEIRKKEVKKREMKSKSIVGQKKKQSLLDKENKTFLYFKKADKQDEKQLRKGSVHTNFQDKKKGKTAREIQNKERKSEDSSHTFRNFKNSTDQESLEQMPNEILSDEGEAKIEDKSRRIIVNAMVSRVSLFKEKMSEMASASQKRSCYLSSDADGHQRIRLDSDQTVKGQCRVLNQRQDDDDCDQVCDERTSDRQQSRLEKAISRSSSIRMPHSSQISFQGMPQSFRALTSLYQNPFNKESNPFVLQTSRNNTSQLFNISNIPKTAQASVTKKSEFQKNQMLNYQEYHSLGFKKIGRVSLDAGRGCFIDGINAKRRVNSIYQFDMLMSDKFQLLKSQAAPKSKVIDTSFDRTNYNDQISQKLNFKNPNSLRSPSSKETIPQVIISPNDRLQTITLSQDLRQQQEEDKKVKRHAASPPYRLQSIYQIKNGTVVPTHFRYHSVNNISKVLNQSKYITRKSDSSLPLSYGSQGQKLTNEGSLKLFNRRQKKLSDNRGCFEGLSSGSSVVPLSSLSKTSRQSKNYLEHNTGVFGQTPVSHGDQQPMLDSPMKEQKDFKFIIKINQETLKEQFIQINQNSNLQDNVIIKNQEQPAEWFKARQVLQQKIRARCGKVKGILKRVVGTQPNSRGPSSVKSDHSSNSVVAYEGGPSKPEAHLPKNNSQYQSDQTIRQSSWSESNGIRGLKVNFESSHQMQKKEVDKKQAETAQIFMETPQSLLSKGVKRFDQNKLDKVLPHDMTFCKKISSCSSYSLKNSKPDFARFEKKLAVQMDTNSVMYSIQARETPKSEQMKLARKNEQMVWYAAYDYDLNILEFQTKLADIRKSGVPIEWKIVQSQIPVKIQFDTALADLPFMQEVSEPQVNVILRLYKVTFCELLEIFKRKALGGQFIEDQFSLKQEWKGSQGLFLLQELDKQNAVSEVENCFERYQKSQRILEGISFDSESSSGKKTQAQKVQRMNKKPFKNQAEMEYAINEVLKKYFFYLHVNCLKRLPQLKDQTLNTNGLFIEGAPVYYMTLNQSQTSVFIPPKISSRPGNCIEEAVQIMTRFQLFTRIRDRAGTPQSLQYTEVNNTHSKILNSMFLGLIQLGYGSLESRDYLNSIQGTKIQLMTFPIMKENQLKQEEKNFFKSNISGEIGDSQISSELEQNKKKAINELISNYQSHQQKLREILSSENKKQISDKQNIIENKSSNNKQVKSCNLLNYQVSKLDQGQVNIQQIDLFADKVQSFDIKQENQTVKIQLDISQTKSIKEQTITSKKKIKNSSESKEKQKQSERKLKNEQACILAIQQIKQTKQSLESEEQEDTRDDGQTDFMPPNFQMQQTDTILTTEQNDHSLQDLSKSLMNNHMLQKNQQNSHLIPQSNKNYSASGSGSVAESNFVHKFQSKFNQDQLVIIRQYDDQLLAKEGSLLNGSIFSKDSNKEKKIQNQKNLAQNQETITREEIDQMQPLFSTVQNSNDYQIKDNLKHNKKESPTVLFQVEKLQKEQIPKEIQPLPEITFMKKYHSRSTIDPVSNSGSASKQADIIFSPTSNKEQNNSKQVKEKKKQLKEQLADLLQQWTLEKEKIQNDENNQQIRDLKLLSQLSASAIDKKDDSNPQKNSQSISDGLETLRQQLESIFEFNKSLIKPLDENDLDNSEIQLRLAKQASKEDECESETIANQVSDHIKKEYESAPKSQTKRVTIVINDNGSNCEFQKSFKQKLNSVNKKSTSLIDSNNLFSKRKIFFGSVGPTSAPSSAGASPICKTLGTFQTKIDPKILNKEASLEVSSMKSILKKKKINSSSSQKSGKSTSEEKKKYEHLFNGLETLLRQLRQNYNQKFNANPHKKVVKQTSDNSSKIGEYLDGLSEFTMSSPVANLTIPNELVSDHGQKLDDFYSNPIVATLLSGWDESREKDRDNQFIRTSMLQSVNVVDMTQSLCPGLDRGKPSTIIQTANGSFGEIKLQNKLTQQ